MKLDVIKKLIGFAAKFEPRIVMKIEGPTKDRNSFDMLKSIVIQPIVDKI